MMRYFLIIYLIAYFGVAFVVPSYRVWKRTGVNPVTFSGADNAHDLIGKMFKAVMAGLTLIIVIAAFVPSAALYLLPVFWLDYSALKYTGVALLILSLTWIVAAQIQMGDSWRIGVDEKKATDLVSSGIFGLSRNPIFLGTLVSLIGFLLSLPNAFTLLFLALGWVLIQVQVRLEEEWLTKLHGETYTAYTHRVRRWL